MALDFSDFGHMSDADLIARREAMIAGNVLVGERIVAGTATPEAKASFHIRLMLVDRVDACLLSRGVEVPPPFWLEED